MSRLTVVDDADDPRVADYVRLRDAVLRRSLEAAEGLFIAEGDKIIRRAVEAGYRPRSFLLAERWLPGLRDLLDAADAPVYVVTEALAERLTGFHVHRGALASLHRETRHQVADLLTARRLVVCEDIVDHANLGTIVRTAAALGWDGVLLSAGCADPLYRRAIKASMGACFSVPWARAASDQDLPQVLSDAGLELVATALTPRALALDDYLATRALERRIALLVGTEGAGLSERWLAASDTVVTIPMAAGVDSLNVAAATAIACYALREVTR